MKKVKFTEALELMSGKKIFRDNWPYHLKYCRDGYLTLCDHVGELTPYAISEYDLNYEWEIRE